VKNNGPSEYGPVLQFTEILQISVGL